MNAAQPYAKAEGRVFLLVPAYPGCPGTKAVKRLLLLLLLSLTVGVRFNLGIDEATRGAVESTLNRLKYRW